ncbi:hypothetical protein [Polaribacter ponticola]|uniref:DUF4252 domain-containing protein n=1 Tax=Polaribacter ponticola TaxID=2978475 RepID=A0ABT5S7M7_9FLAO|nr:hypothetical protein [Polaribacter sp. MSW5]MDD7913819.1 hypothetical protein [Polaribacter sp. MSW5]
MNKIIIVLILTSWSIKAQINTKIEGITINSICELEYTRNLGNQNNYACVSQDSNEKIMQYSVTVQNLFEDMKGMNEKTLKIYKDQFFLTTKENSESNGEKTTLIKLKNGQKALSIVSELTYSVHKFINTSIVFLYKQKSFIVNLTTNNLNRKNEIRDLTNRILFK